jgi:3,4-dihydroxy 2-butanone 4-phosphate synthase/GTP cyclohydrolase II
MSYNSAHIEAAIADIKAGKMVIVVDDASRENEGDLMIAADHVTPDAINFMAQYGRGLICMPMPAEDFARLGIDMMVSENQSSYQTAFGVSIGAKKGITTGISAADRAYTIALANDPKSGPGDLVRPGHVFPLKARAQGVLAREGHTEACTDLARMAGCRPVAALCEIMNPDGSMARMPELEVFAKQHNLKIVSIEDLVQYRLQNEILATRVASSTLPLDDGLTWQVHVFRSDLDGSEITALVSPVRPQVAPLVRLHSQCLTGDVLGSKRCDCGWQLKTAMARIGQEGGALLYLPQEGRGIGLANKIKAYALQDQGLDTVEANHALGFAADERHYAFAAQVLKALQYQRIHLLSNNPQKQSELAGYGLDVAQRESLLAPTNPHNEAYLKTKQHKLAHYLNLEEGRDHHVH